MHKVSELYRSIYAGTHWKEVMLLIEGTEYFASSIISLSTFNSLYAENRPVIGSCVAAEINLSYIPGDNIPPCMAKIEPFVRITNGSSVSEWIPKGVFYSDTRIVDEETGVYTIHGFDSMLKAEQAFFTEGDTGEWPRTAPIIAAQIAEKMGVSVDSRTVLQESILVPFPNDFTCREILGQIAVAHGGNWIISDAGELRLVGLNSIPQETNLLVDGVGDVIKFGEVAIVVG